MDSNYGWCQQNGCNSYTSIFSLRVKYKPNLLHITCKACLNCLWLTKPDEHFLEFFKSRPVAAG